MKSIAFVLPLNRFEDNDNLATRAALRQAFAIQDHDIETMIGDALGKRQFVLNFRCDPLQFSEFLILRNELGARNLFSELKPRVLDRTAPTQNKRIVDFTGPAAVAKGGFHIHDHLPQHMVDRDNEERRARKRDSLASGYGMSGPKISAVALADALMQGTKVENEKLREMLRHAAKMLEQASSRLAKRFPNFALHTVSMVHNIRSFLEG